MEREAAAELFERQLHETCSDDEWNVFHRRLHPEQYPQRLSLRRRLYQWVDRRINQ